MARKGSNGGDLPPTKKWAAASFFLVGVVFVALFVYGPPSDGRGDVLKILGSALIGVAVTLFLGINLPTYDLSGIVVRILTAILEGQKKGSNNE